MTVIAWDGKTLAADKMSVEEGTIRSTTKIMRLKNGQVAAIAGTFGCFGPLIEWLESGRDPATWPTCQRTEDFGVIVVASTDGLEMFEREPWPIRFDEPFAAFGNGREAAMGAMAMGADAVKAVEIASRFVLGCGRGVDAMVPS